MKEVSNERLAELIANFEEERQAFELRSDSDTLLALRELQRRRSLSPYPDLDADRLKRATNALKFMAKLWNGKPSGGYAAGVLEDMWIGPLPTEEG